MEGFQQNNTDSQSNNIILIARLLLFVTLLLLLCSYLYYQCVGKYDKAEFCFDNRCFYLTSSAHLNPHEFQQIKLALPAPFVIPDSHVHERYLQFLKSDMYARCQQDEECITRVNNSDMQQLLTMKKLGNWFNPFIAKTHDALSVSPLHKPGKPVYSLQNVKQAWIKKAVAVIQQQLAHPENTRFRHVVLRLDKQGFPIICGEVADNFDAGSFVNYVRSFINLVYRPFIYLGQNNTLIWRKSSDENLQSTDFDKSWKKQCYQR